GPVAGRHRRGADAVPAPDHPEAGQSGVRRIHHRGTETQRRQKKEINSSFRLLCVSVPLWFNLFGTAMLKRLELVGFKSFADKTAFEFPPGVTAIVGPNGSGKSNVVDAVKWVLGEQSAKSLRGGEMADVIFNGSTSRRSLGLAEVSVLFDNSRGVLNTTAAEVRVARRVYRDGEGEYLINGQPCRLKDIRDLF